MSNKHRHNKTKTFLDKKSISVREFSNMREDIDRPILETIKENLIDIIEKTLLAFKEDPINIFLIENMSNRTIHSITIYNDRDSMNISIILYSLYKLLINDLLDQNHINRCISFLNEMLTNLKNNKFKEYRLTTTLFIKFISEISKKFNRYVQSLIDKAKIKKGSELYRHGISIGMISELFGTSEWELMSYLGHTNINEFFGEEDPIKRLKTAEKFFGLK